MAFSADELRVLRRALVGTAQPTPVPDHEVRAGLRLARAIDDVLGEAARQRAFLLADLDRYRAALPGSATGYLEQLQEALTAGYLPTEADLTALRGLCAEPTGPYEAARRALLLVRAALPGVRGPLLVLPGGLATALPSRVRTGCALAPAAASAAAEGAAGDAEGTGDADTSGKDEGGRRPAAPGPAPARPRTPAKPVPAPAPGKPVPTPAEVFPPRRRPAPPAEGVLAAALLA